MHVDDEDWQRCFGTSDSQIEPVQKPGKKKMNAAQAAAKMITDTARTRDAAIRERNATDSTDESSSAETQQTRS